MPSPPYCGLDLAPSLADLFIRGSPQSITARYFSSNPSDSGSLRTPCPPTSKLAGRRGITPAFGYSAPHPSAGGTLTLLIHALPSAHYGPLRHPNAPGLSLTGVRLLIPVTHWGFPCCVRFPCVHAAATTPVQRLGVLDAHLTQPCQPSPEGSPGRPAHRPFRGLLGVHSRCGLHTRAVTVFRDPLSEGFRHFCHLHACSGCFRLERSPGGTCTHWKAPPFFTAHTRS